MPSLKEGRAAPFEPIPPDLDVNELVYRTENFRFVQRFPASLLDDPDQFEHIVRNAVILQGEPIVIEGLERNLAPWLFNSGWLEQNYGDKVAMVRDLEASQDQAWTIGHYLRNMSTFTRNIKPMRYNRGQRLYLKDMDVPEQWHDSLKEVLSPFLYYYNDGTGEYGGPGAVDDVRGKGRGVAVSGDLMSSLPKDFRAVNMLCYIGHEGTYTPAHREMCGSLGQNIMVETSTSIGLDGKPTIPGSSLWFMTRTKDRFLVSEYWMSNLGHDIEVESHFASIDAWAKAPFTTYVVEQKLGDFILIPPLAPHQVWNRGTRTMKAAWNRTTVETLELAMNEAVPRARLVCRDEAYKNKAIIFYTLDKYAHLLRRIGVGAMVDLNEEAAEGIRKSKKIRRLKKDFIRLFKLFNDIMLSEMFSPSLPQPSPQRIPYQSDVLCSYCRCNIFNRFLTCKECSLVDDEGGEEDDYDICMDCFVMGRSCWCLNKQKWVEQWKWSQLAEKHEEWRSMVIEIEGSINEHSPQKLDEARKRLGKKTLAAVCQEQLKIRRRAKRKDPALEKPEEEEEPVVKEDGHIKRRKPRKSGTLEDSNCHVCKIRHDNWKMAHCGCGKSYCYGNLYRAFDLLPADVMEQPDWKCPFCLRICSCGQCRKDGKMKPYEPKLTCLGHDTKKIADARSVESLVDFSRSNTIWLRSSANDTPHETARLKNMREQAERENPSAELLDADDDDEVGNIQELSMVDAPHELGLSVSGGIPIDPLLSADQSSSHVGIEDQHGPSQVGSELHHGSYQPLLNSYGCQYGRDALFPPPSSGIIADNQPVRRYQSPSDVGPSTPYGALTPFPSTSDSAISGLEHDPHSFIAAAGLTSLYSSQSPRSHQPVPNFVAPSATMISQRPEHDGYGVHHQSSDGIRSRGEKHKHSIPNNANVDANGNPEYPDQMDNTKPYPRVREALQAGDEPPHKKRKRKDSSAVQSDIPGSMEDAQHEFEQAQWHSTLQKAKKDGNYYLVRARRENKHLVAKLHIGTERLSSLTKNQGEQQEQGRPSPTGLDGFGDEHDEILVTSDLAPTAANFKALALANAGIASASRPLPSDSDKSEEHPAFKGKRRGRPPKTSRSPISKAPKEQEKIGRHLVEPPEDTSDIEMGMKRSGPGRENIEESIPKKGRASAWLSRKNQDEQADLLGKLPAPQPTKRFRNRKNSNPAHGSDISSPGDFAEANHCPGGVKSTTPSHKSTEIKRPRAQPGERSQNPSENPARVINVAGARPAPDPATLNGIKPRRKSNGESAAEKAYRESKLIAMRLAEGKISEISFDSDSYSSVSEKAMKATKITKITEITEITKTPRTPSHSREKVVTTQKDTPSILVATKKPMVRKFTGPLPSRLQGKNIKIISAKEAERRKVASSAPPPKAENPVPSIASRRSMPSPTNIVGLSRAYSDSDSNSQSSGLNCEITARSKVFPPYSKNKAQRNGLNPSSRIPSTNGGRLTSNRALNGRRQRVLDDREEGLFGEEDQEVVLSPKEFRAAIDSIDRRL
ncbi:hypothetical protein FGG08_001200 [Glutinoglossum americanum]|uniref:JmjC domain-containing protein n=1 Tax=Glutinoglossum americanum TaxID=1670608 RepID=A0A9P8L5I0_9PEZI|nr:hypothetical protein FGG08_001200 [Glutinoglossum americanum]